VLVAGNIIRETRLVSHDSGGETKAHTYVIQSGKYYIMDNEVSKGRVEQFHLGV
jgi:hypothetical protein